MPSSNIHLKVGYELNKRLNINSTDFIVGNIAPDAVNLNGFAPKEERWTSHLRDKDYDIWIEKAHDFYNDNVDKYENEFLLGYISHILTDVIHDKYLYMKQRREILKTTNCQDDEAHDLLRKDMDNYSFVEFEQVKEQLNKYKNTYKILNISEDKLDKWIKRVIEIYRGNSNSKYQTNEDMELLITLVEDELKKIIYKEEIKYK